jgi:uncharacterized membrane protein
VKQRLSRRLRDLAAALFGTLILCVPRVALAAQPAESLVRGFVQTGDASGIWTLRRCGDTAEVPIRDQTQGDALTVAVAEVRRAMQDSRRGVFVEFQGIVTRDQAIAKRLWRVLGYVADCAKAPDNVAADATLWASGNEPAWRLVVRGKIATFTRFGFERVSFSAAALTPQVPRRSYQAQTGSTKLTLEIDEQICLDPPAEAAYGARVTATVSEKGKTQTLQGCAARY